MKLTSIQTVRDVGIQNHVRSTRAESATPSRFAELARGNNEIVLVVDDEPVVGGAMARILRRLDYRVLEASGTVEGQRIVDAETKIDLLITDFSMLESNELEFARWFRSRFPDTPVLMVTGSLWELNYQAESLGEFSILTKLFSAFDLARMTRRVLD